jgi:hypothetical protein
MCVLVPDVQSAALKGEGAPIVLPGRQDLLVKPLAECAALPFEREQEAAGRRARDQWLERCVHRSNGLDRLLVDEAGPLEKGERTDRERIEHDRSQDCRDRESRTFPGGLDVRFCCLGQSRRTPAAAVCGRPNRTKQPRSGPAAGAERSSIVWQRRRGDELPEKFSQRANGGATGRRHADVMTCQFGRKHRSLLAAVRRNVRPRLCLLAMRGADKDRSLGGSTSGRTPLFTPEKPRKIPGGRREKGPFSTGKPAFFPVQKPKWQQAPWREKWGPNPRKPAINRRLGPFWSANSRVFLRRNSGVARLEI